MVIKYSQSVATLYYVHRSRFIKNPPWSCFLWESLKSSVNRHRSLNGSLHGWRIRLFRTAGWRMLTSFFTVFTIERKSLLNSRDLYLAFYDFVRSIVATNFATLFWTPWCFRRGSRILIGGGGGGCGAQKIMRAHARLEREERNPLRPGSRARL